MSFADNLKRLREQKGLTQSKLAEMVGVSQPTINDYEKGKKQPVISTAVDLARELNTTCEELVNK